MTNTGNRKMVGGDGNGEMRQMTARICRDYLQGAWKEVTPQNIIFKHISGGLSNLLYYISLPDTLKKETSVDEPQEVLVRVYGQTHGERALESLITDSVIFTLLSERGLGPKLHGIFPGGRIEQFINARPLRTAELAEERLSVRIAKKMAAIHNMEVPLHKEPRWLWDTMSRWLRTCEQMSDSKGLPEIALHVLRDTDLRKECDWLKQRVIMSSSPVVFCHNDMQEGNILLRADQEDSDDPQLVLIDFEYCSYNYRAFDIANHFVEWMFDYTSTTHPFFTIRHDGYPTRAQQERFVRAYLDESAVNSSTDQLINKILIEVETFTLVSHLFWSLWACVNARTSQIPFGYWEYAMTRLSYYMNAKRRLVDGGRQPVKRKADLMLDE